MGRSELTWNKGKVRAVEDEKESNQEDGDEDKTNK